MTKEIEVNMDYKKIFAIKQKNREVIKKQCPNINDKSGIYILTRYDNGFKYAYVGQAVKVWSRLSDHLNGYQHIDLSIKKHKFYSSDNPTGWKIAFFNCPTADLDRLEQEYIMKLANQGYQLRNKTSGSQGEGKQGFDTAKQPKTYTEGKVYGYKKALSEIAVLFDKYLNVSTKKDNAICNRKLQEFIELIKGEEENGREQAD